MTLRGFPAFFNFDTNVFLMLWLVNFLFISRQEAMDFMILPMVFCPIRILVYQTSVDFGRLMMLRQSGPVSFIPSGRLENQSLKSRTGSVFPPLVLYITCGVVLLIVRHRFVFWWDLRGTVRLQRHLLVIRSST